MSGINRLQRLKLGLYAAKHHLDIAKLRVRAIERELAGAGEDVIKCEATVKKYEDALKNLEAE